METTTKENIMENKVIEISMVAIVGIMQGNMRDGNTSGQFYAIKGIVQKSSEVIEFIRNKGE